MTARHVHEWGKKNERPDEAAPENRRLAVFQGIGIHGRGALRISGLPVFRLRAIARVHNRFDDISG